MIVIPSQVEEIKHTRKISSTSVLCLFPPRSARSTHVDDRPDDLRPGSSGDAGLGDE